MALMVPDTVSSKASLGEKQLFKLLRDELPDDFFVYYEPIVNGLYPDFIILSATLGLLILEVKGWSASQVERANNQFFEINLDGKLEHCPSPLRQGKGYLDALMNQLKGYSVLCQDDGDYQGKLVFPIGVGAILTGMTEAQAREACIYSLLEKPQICYRDELMEWADLGERGIIKRLEKFFTTRFKFWGLEDDQLSTIRGIIHPEARVREEPAKLTSVPQEQVIKPDANIIKVLDHRQEQLARSLNSGHRLLCGVAGSGKTLILVSRAKIIAGELFEKKILLLCFNITLAAWIRTLIEQDNNPIYQQRIEVMHFHAWAKSLLGRLPNPKVHKDCDYDEMLGEMLIEVLEQIPVEQKWDALLIDEAHTFSPSWFRACRLALKDPDNGDLLIVSDRMQSIYQRQHFTWKSVGIKASGRTRKLTQNYRNTQEILSAAWDIIKSLSLDEDADETFPVVEPKAALRAGSRPILHLMNDRLAEVSGAIALLQQLVSSGYLAEDIAIIYRYLGKHEEKPLSYLTEQLKDSDLGCYWVTQSEMDKRTYGNHRQGVRLVTAKSALGLEFKIVILLWVQQFGVGNENEAKKELYVAMTRAQDILHMFGSGKFDFLRALQHCECFDVA